MRTGNILLILLLVTCCAITGCSLNQEPPPIQTLLDVFAEAVQNQDIESMTGLILAPDETPDGVQRKRMIDEVQEEWVTPSIPENARVTFTNVVFDNKSLLKADMNLGRATEVYGTMAYEFKVCLSNNQWKIVTASNHPKRANSQF